MAKVIPVSLDDPANPIRCEFSLIDTDIPGKWRILLARFIGEYRIGHLGDPDGMYIASMARAALFNWGPSGVILDLSQLDYKWGDMMELVLNPGQWAGFETPFAVVVGRGCRDAIASLIFGVDTPKPATEIPGFFDTLPAAIDYIQPLCGPCSVTAPKIIRDIFGGGAPDE